MANRTGTKTEALRPNWLRRRMAKWAFLAYRLGLGPLLARWVMVLTTRGRVSGRARRTPLWYIRQGNTIYCLSGWGPSSDWFRNLGANADVLVRIGGQTWETRGEIISDPPQLERILRSFREKYGRMVPVFYHMDRLRLVAFPAHATVEAAER